MRNENLKRIVVA